MRSDRRSPLGPLLAGALAAAGLAAPALAADLSKAELGDWDADGDGVLEREEFMRGFGGTGVYGEWDSDGGGWLVDEELNKGLGDAVVYDNATSRIWDLDDGNTEIDEATFGNRYFDSYDEDGSGTLEGKEWQRFERDARERGWLGS